MNKPPWGIFEKLTTTLLSVVVAMSGYLFTTLQSHGDRLTKLEAGREADRLTIINAINERVDVKLDKMLLELKALDKKLDATMADLRVHMAKQGTAGTSRTNIYHLGGGLRDHDYVAHDIAN